MIFNNIFKKMNKEQLIHYYLSLPINIKRAILKDMLDGVDFDTYSDTDIEKIFKEVVIFYV